MRRNVAKKTTLILILCAVVATGALAVISKGYTDFNVHSWVTERNPDNLIDYKFNVGPKYSKGVTYTIDEHGVIHLEGYLQDNGAATKWFYRLGQMVLPAGRYTLSCEGTLNLFCSISMAYENTEGNTKEIYAGGGNTVEFTEPTLVTFNIRISKAGNVDYTLYPVLNKGANPVKFFVKKGVGK